MPSSKRDEEQVPDATGLTRGTNQTGVRLYNERLVLSLIRRHSSLPKAEIARATGLTPQTISIIINQLTRDGLLLKGKPVRGRIGQPSVPYSINPDGAYAFGLKIGRRSVDLYLINSLGRILGLLHQTYPYPMPDDVIAFARKGIRKLMRHVPAEGNKRISGLGIASPYEIWTWPAEIGAPQQDIDAWRTVDIRSEIAREHDWPVYFANDITAACAAELMFGIGSNYADYLYVYVGSFIGGGLVLDGHLFPGRTQNAAALGSMLAPAADGKAQLMNVASIYVLERKLVAQGRDAGMLWQSPDEWGDVGPVLEEWEDEVAHNLAIAIVNSIAVIDVGTVIVDGAFPSKVRKSITEKTRLVLQQLPRQGLSKFLLVEGTIGNAARAMGGASLPLLANFTQDREVLFKENVTALR